MQKPYQYTTDELDRIPGVNWAAIAIHKGGLLRYPAYLRDARTGQRQIQDWSDRTQWTCFDRNRLPNDLLWSISKR
jgi:hypothetical protein